MKVRIRASLIYPSLVLALVGVALISSSAHADDTYVTTTTITIPESCSITSTLDTPHTATIPAGIYSGNYNSDGHNYTNGIGQTTIKAFCNDSGGFAIYAIGYTNDTYGNTVLIGPDNNNIATGTATSGGTSNWAMKIGAVSGTYAPTIAGTYGSYTAVPSSYDKVASFNAVTDNTNGSSITTTYAAYIASNQQPGTYNGKVKYTLVHPSSADTPLQPQVTQAGKICYYPNGSNVEGTMGCQTVSASATSATLLASNFSREGYGFAGWSKTFDYSDSTGFLGPQETISFTAGQYTGSNPGLSLYAHWIKSEGSLQDFSCPDNTTMSIGTVKALTDQRDNDTYAIAKLADGNCWMIENMRLENTNSDNSTGALAQGYGASATYGSFSGLANPENSNFISSASSPTVQTEPNSLYYAGTQSGTATINISQTSYAGFRMPRYNNWNTPTIATDRPSNPTTNSVINNSSNAGIYSYGNYYTWSAALANTIYYNEPTATDADGKTSETVGTSLCPKGWRLPYGRSSGNGAISGGFSYLDIQLSGTGANQSTTVASNRWRVYPNNFLYSGYFGTSSADNRGSSGLYWSSTAKSYDYSYDLVLDSASISPGSSIGLKYGGLSIRCLTPGA